MKLLNQMRQVIDNKDADFYSEADTEEIEKLLTGAKLKLKCKDDRDAVWYLHKDGKTYHVKLEGNRGCVCENGNTFFDAIGECENIITRAEVKTEETEYEFGEHQKYEIFVYAENTKITLAKGSCTDNGYYGMGYTLIVTDITEEQE